MRKWNPEKKNYENYDVPGSWKCVGAVNQWESFANEDDEINCSRCGKKVVYKDTYASRYIHGDSKRFAICSDCRVQEDIHWPDEY